MYTDSDNSDHEYYILYNKDNFDEIVLVAEEDIDDDKGELFTY